MINFLEVLAIPPKQVYNLEVQLFNYSTIVFFMVNIFFIILMLVLWTGLAGVYTRPYQGDALEVKDE